MLSPRMSLISFAKFSAKIGLVHDHRTTGRTENMLPPILEIYLLWHSGDDTLAKPLAERIARHFQGGAFASLLAGAVDVQTHSVGWSSEDSAPRQIVWPEDIVAGHQPQPARHVAVVPLIGRELNRALMPHDGSPAWRQTIDEIGQRVSTPTGLVLPICLDTSGLSADWPVSVRSMQSGGAIDALIKANTLPSEERDARRLLDLVQSLAQWLSGGARRLQVFISHTKRLGHADEAVESLVAQVRAVLGNGSRMRSFYDAHDLQPGEDWDRALRENAATSAVLALRTDRYASREWCQREVLTAKQHGMPVVMLDALTQGEERGSFLLDHVPRLPVRRRADGGWDDSSIRHTLQMLADAWLHRALWQRQRNLAHAAASPYADYSWLEQAPEPSTFPRWLAPDGNTLRLLHPDPPMATPEHEVLMALAARCGITALDITTPRLLAARGADLRDAAAPLLARNGLRGRRIGLSASGSEDLARLGLLPEHLRQALRELARIVFVSGGTLAYGGNLDRDKFSWLLIEELRHYDGPDCGRLELWLSWQEHRRRSVDELTQTQDALGRYGRMFAIGEDGQRLADPISNREASPCPPISDDLQLKRGLTHLRHHLTAGGCARLLIGGKHRPQQSTQNHCGFTGAIPGLIEEVLMSLRQQQPVYLAGGFGGITLHIAAQIDSTTCTPLLPPEVTLDPGTQDALDEVRRLVGERGWSVLRNGLSDDQNRHLAVTHRPAEIAMLVAQGLGRLPEMPAGPQT